MGWCRKHATPWTSCQIRTIAGCACAGNAGNVSPRHRLQRKPLVSDPDMHHGTCVTHVPWCMSGSLTRSGGENVPGIPGACVTRNFTYLARGPLLTHWCWVFLALTHRCEVISHQYCQLWPTLKQSNDQKSQLSMSMKTWRLSCLRIKHYIISKSVNVFSLLTLDKVECSVCLQANCIVPMCVIDQKLWFLSVIRKNGYIATKFHGTRYDTYSLVVLHLALFRMIAVQCVSG